MMTLIAVALGGALGASLRFGVNQLVVQVFNMPVFWATLLVNVIGCLLMGKAYTYFIDNQQISEAHKVICFSWIFRRINHLVNLFNGNRVDDTE